MGLPTHPNATVRTRLQKAWSKAHKNWTGGYPAQSEADALNSEDTSYLVGGHAEEDVLGADGTVDRAIDAAADDRAARDSGQRGNT